MQRPRIGQAPSVAQSSALCHLSIPPALSTHQLQSQPHPRHTLVSDFISPSLAIGLLSFSRAKAPGGQLSSLHFFTSCGGLGSMWAGCLQHTPFCACIVETLQRGGESSGEHGIPELQPSPTPFCELPSLRT